MNTDLVETGTIYFKLRATPSRRHVYLYLSLQQVAVCVYQVRNLIVRMSHVIAQRPHIVSHIDEYGVIVSSSVSLRYLAILTFIE